MVCRVSSQNIGITQIRTNSPNAYNSLLLQSMKCECLEISVTSFILMRFILSVRLCHTQFINKCCR